MLVKISKVAAMRNSMFAASHGDGAGKHACAGTKQNKTNLIPGLEASGSRWRWCDDHDLLSNRAYSGHVASSTISFKRTVPSPTGLIPHVGRIPLISVAVAGGLILSPIKVPFCSGWGPHMLGSTIESLKTESGTFSSRDERKFPLAGMMWCFCPWRPPCRGVPCDTRVMLMRQNAVSRQRAKGAPCDC